MNKKVIFIGSLLILLTSAQLLMTQEKTQQKNTLAAVESPAQPAVGGGFTLTDQDGKTVHDSDYHGRALLVSFGFTHCPDICPITVSNLSQTMEQLGPRADQVAALFISVDPARDTPAVMKDFLHSFDRHITGLTGTELQVKQVADAYKVYYARATPEGAKSDYGVDHSGYIYLMGKDGQFIRVFPYDVPPKELADAVAAILK